MPKAPTRNKNHEKSVSCLCSECIEDRTTRSCKDPHACVTGTAAQEQTQNTPGREDDETCFKPPKSIETLTQGLRVLTNRTNEAKERPPVRVRRRLIESNTTTNVTVHISNATHAPPQMRKRAAAGVVYGVNDNRNKGFRVLIDEDQTPYVAEIFV
ncbi:hypothetical protein B0H19DRAFT_1187527 [Mycena capillaripes]|nr:hypothetical protein B0H19DRAFT_1187527 [Mycena capillaripes]